jgi:hypothetical protein
MTAHQTVAPRIEARVDVFATGPGLRVVPRKMSVAGEIDVYGEALAEFWRM